MRVEHLATGMTGNSRTSPAAFEPSSVSARAGRPLACILFGVGLLSGCDTGTEETTSISSTRVVQRAYVAAPSGTVPRGESRIEGALLPPGPEASPELIRRGEERFLVFCSPCHGAEGRGNGRVVAHGLPAPPTYHQERLRALSPLDIVTVITRGSGRMYSYADRVEPHDRWAIAHYVKLLQERNPSAGAVDRSVTP
jgi:mono/diheme cytochrome c family protein